MTQWRGMVPPWEVGEKKPDMAIVARVELGDRDTALSVAELQIRGWSLGLIRKFLGQRDFTASVNHFLNYSGKAMYFRDRVIAAEALTDWQQAHERLLTRRARGK